MFQRIVVGADGSSQALHAVDVAIELARLTGAEVHVVTAASPQLAADIERMRTRLPEEFQQVWDPYAENHTHLAEAVARVRAAGLEAVPHDLTGDPVDGIMDVADEVDADLVVVGSRGLGTARRLLLGSVSAKLAHHCDRHLLIVHPEG